MRKKFRTALALRCKDMGLTDKAIDKLTDIACEGLADDTSDEDIEKKVDGIVPFAQAMQAEITRKTTKMQPQSTVQSNKEGEGEGEGGKAEVIPAWAKALQEKLSVLENENSALKTAKAKSERTKLISDKAKELGIPEYLMRRVSFADDADWEKELNDYKQDLVNNNLVPKEQAHETGTTEEQMKADAKSWADRLPSA